jgi:hypothetical protein
MKNNLLKFYITAFFFCSTLLTFAQDTPGTNDDTNSMEELDPVPLDDYIWVLIAIGLVFAFLRFRAISQQRSLQK